jgi:ribosome-binding protein aMBF1 (putative translation factor)
VHPKGPLRTVDNAIRDRVRKQIENKGWQQKDLADKLSLSEGSITNLLKPGPPRQIKYLPQLLSILGIEDDLKTIEKAWPDLSAEDRAVILALVAARTAPKNDER